MPILERWGKGLIAFSGEVYYKGKGLIAFSGEVYYKGKGVIYYLLKF